MVSHASSPSEFSPTPKRPISERQLAANRANAKHSTGPRTPEGKERSRRNGLKHGRRAKLPPDGVPAFDLIDDEAPDAYRAIRKALHADVRPSGALEELIVERIARAAWRMRRADAAEVELFDLGEIDRVTDTYRAEYRHRHALDSLATAREGWSGPTAPPAPNELNGT